VAQGYASPDTSRGARVTHVCRAWSRGVSPRTEQALTLSTGVSNGSSADGVQPYDKPRPIQNCRKGLLNAVAAE
jgi:hypothetical protein